MGHRGASNAFAAVNSWSETQVVATVASDALSGIARIQQNGINSNAVAFSVPPADSSTALTINPNVLTMVVGDTHTIQAVNPQGQPVTGLAWTSSDTTVVSLSTDDPPILTAVAVGHVTITAGNASADVTVFAGPTLPIGTVQWGNPGDGSGVTSIVPAVPSASGVDVFAFEASGNVAAITTDGTTLWTANVANASQTLPDFQGGLVMVIPVIPTPMLQKLDGMTGQPYPAYTFSQFLNGPVAVHTDGTVFAVDGDMLVGIDPLTGSAKFGVHLTDSTGFETPFCECPQCGGSSVNPPAVRGLSIAGDGNAYITYSYTNATGDPQIIGNCNLSIFHEDQHLRVMRVSPQGASAETSFSCCLRRFTWLGGRPAVPSTGNPTVR